MRGRKKGRRGRGKERELRKEGRKEKGKELREEGKEEVGRRGQEGRGRS